MVRRITSEQKEEMWNLFCSGSSVKRIARDYGISYVAAWVYTRGREEGFESSVDWREFLARQMVNPDTGRPFGRYSEYCKQKILKRINPDTGRPYQTVWEYSRQFSKRKPRRMVAPEVREAFSQVLREALAERGMSMYALAKALNTNHQNVNNWCSGKSLPFGERVAKLENYMGLPFQNILECSSAVIFRGP